MLCGDRASSEDTIKKDFFHFRKDISFYNVIHLKFDFTTYMYM